MSEEEGYHCLTCKYWKEFEQYCPHLDINPNEDFYCSDWERKKVKKNE